jgi:TetR/AcrR family transcriptional regulator, cholesterol catabolism regulator
VPALIQKMENRERIIEGAAGLFRTYGIKSVTMDSIASELGMSKRTIYEVFSDKDELLGGVLKWMNEKHKGLVARVLSESENALEAIFKLLEINTIHFKEMSPAFLADIKKYHRDVLMSRNFKSEMPDYRNNQQLIERGIKENLFRKEINPDLVNRCLFSLVRSIMDQDLYPFEEFSRSEVVKNVFINYLRGISTAEGINLINKLEEKF